jgi:hypothetical protein
MPSVPGHEFQGRDVDVKHIVSLSGGMSSAIAADRVLDRYGHDATTLWFADTAWEDLDLHRFLFDLQQRWGKEIVTHRDGRTPLEVAEDEKIIPNQRLAPCTFRLKIDPFRRYLETFEKPVTVHIGMDWRETKRMEAPKARYEKIKGVSVDYPLMWAPIEYRPYGDVMEEWGITVPRLYKMGLTHNNCGGRCVKQGVGNWKRLYHSMPERFKEVEDWETAQRAKGGKLANYAISRDQKGGKVRPKPLSVIRQEAETEHAEELPLIDDNFSCFCAS